MAADFSTVETLRVKTMYVLFFVHLNTRRTVVTGASEHPNEFWVRQQTRNVGLACDDLTVGFVIHDRDTKFTSSFGYVSRASGTEIIRTPFRSPKANTFAERRVRTVRNEGLDWTLISGRRHLKPVLRDYLDHYNEHRPHRRLGLCSPMRPSARRPSSSRAPERVRRHDRGGLLHEYYAVA